MVHHEEIKIQVISRTGGATWVVKIYDSQGSRSDLMYADEGCSHPHRWLAEQEAEDIAARIGWRRCKILPYEPIDC